MISVLPSIWKLYHQTFNTESMEDYTNFRIELEISAQKVIHQMVVHNEAVKQQLEDGIKRAVENYDFQSTVEEMVSKVIKDAIWNSISYGKLKEAVSTKVSEIADQLIEKHISHLKS